MYAIRRILLDFSQGFPIPGICPCWYTLSAASSLPPDMLGRVSTLQGSLIAVMAPMGLALAGPVVDATGARIWYVIAGIIMMAMGVGSLFIPDVMQIEGGARPGAKEAGTVASG